MSATAPQSHCPAIPGAGELSRLLDALAADTLSHEQFVLSVVGLERQDPDALWEALAMLDRHYRCGRIPRETCMVLTARLQRHALGIHTVGEPVELPPEDDAEPLPLPAVRPRLKVSGNDSSDDTPFDGELRVGDLLRGRYLLVDELARNANGTVFEAIDEFKAEATGLRQRVAIQTLDGASSSDPTLLQRLHALRALSHSCITRFGEVDEERETLFVTMELFAGVPLREFFERNAGLQLSRDAALAIVQAVGNALACAHARGVAHGALGSDTIHLNPQGELRLQGFCMQGLDTGRAMVADRLAFAWLAYELLSGTRDWGASRSGTGALRAPPGLSRDSWRVLRETLRGGEALHGDRLLTVFGTPQAPWRRIPLLPRPARAARLAHQEAIATGVAVLIVAAGSYLLFQQEVAPQRPVSYASPVTTAAAVVPQRAAPRPSVAQLPAPAPAIAQHAEAARRGPEAPAALIPPTIDLPTQAIWVNDSLPVARVWVRRRGDLNQPVTFRWWTETGSAQVDRDFRGVIERNEVIPSGARGIGLLVPLVPDPSRMEARTFYVKIDGAGRGARLGDRTLMQVAIVPPRYATSAEPESARAAVTPR